MSIKYLQNNIVVFSEEVYSYTIVANDRIAAAFKLSEAQRHDVPQGHELLESIDFSGLITDEDKIKLLADMAYEDGKTIKLILEKGFEPAILAKSS